MSLHSILSQPSTSRTGALLARRLAHPRLPTFAPALAASRPFSSTRRTETSHFDTHLFVQRLEKQGLNRTQAEGVMTVLAEVVDESIKGMEAALVSKAEQEKERYTQKVDFAALKAELQLHEKNDLTLMKAENDRLLADVEKLKQRLREEVTRTQAGVRLDLNLEKGRIRDESSQQELKIKEVDTRIESEIAGLRTQIEQAKFSILQYLVGVATGSGALLLADDACVGSWSRTRFF
ncbi:putative mitochondrion protein [Dioszegia hungarica]|uniref:Mitochondrion protein n=1 Tax=Dioszegia hungarica TaxID=4972 RepID=A0AA38HCD3_9TREE|nr:putative mitochondrion protein [Dioszegia hungarica]KAI9636964.1 putative mitochondrion protein [Dioszegia hungarica]